MDKDADNNMDMDNDIDTDNSTATDKDMDTDMALVYLCQISIWRYSRYSAIWIICVTSGCRFQQRYRLVVALPQENYDMQIFLKFIPPLGLFSKRCVGRI